MESGRDIVRHLQNVFFGIGDTKIVDPLQVTLQSSSVIDGGVTILISSGIRDVAIHISNVGRSECCTGIDAKTWFWITPSVSNPKYRDEDASEESPEKTWKEDMITEFFLFPKRLIYVR
jgi:hypothetical protein